MNFTLTIFLVGILGFVMNRNNIILMLISIEIMLLGITLIIIVSSLSFDDILGQTFAIYVIAIAGAESAIGLGILVAYYRLYSSLIPGCLSFNLKTYSKNNFNSSSRYPSFIYFSNKRVLSYSTKAFNNEKVKRSVLGLKGYNLVPLFITGLFDPSSKKQSFNSLRDKFNIYSRSKIYS